MNKYDRQVRLWGQHAQTMLQTAHIFIYGLQSASYQTAKNLVLAGIGKIIILDQGATVQPADIGRYFGINTGDIGNNLAQKLKILLQQINPDCKIQVSQTSQVQSDLDLYFTVSWSLALEIQAQILKKGKKAILVNQWGYYVLAKCVSPNIEHIEVQLPNQKFYSSVKRPFDKLIQLAYQFKGAESQHPWVVILAALSVLNLSKEDVKERLQQWLKISQNSTNFLQAKKKINELWAEDVSYELERLFQLSEKKKNNQFWCVIQAIRKFRQNYGRLPIRSEVPDMSSTTQLYLQVKQIYKQQHRLDCLQLQKQSNVQGSLVSKMVDSIFILGYTQFSGLNELPEGQPLLARLHQFWRTGQDQIAELSGIKWHLVGAVVGGIICNQAVKLVTAKYMPQEWIALNLDSYQS